VSTWTDLLATALVGTDRRPSSGDSSEVLDAAAAWAAYRRAGTLAEQGVATPAPAPVETIPVVGDAAARRLFALLADDVAPLARVFSDAATRAALVDEWLAAAASRGWRVPAANLPQLLDHGRYHTNLRHRIAAVGGARIHWLAAQNPQWRYLGSVESTSDDPMLWTNGSPGQRSGYLRSLRRRDPTAARTQLERDWPALTPEERADLLATLGDELSASDEPMLERALDDRRREVRDTAARLLALLAESAYARRMAARALACVELRGRMVVAVNPPAECDPSMRRDGIDPKPPGGSGARAWWLEEILARTPLRTWPRPVAVGDAATEWTATVHRGLARAAAAHHDAEWAAIALDGLGDTVRDRELSAALYPVLDRATLVRRAIDALRQGRTPLWGPLLSGCPAPWPDALGRAALAGIDTLARQPRLTGDLYRLCRLAAVRVPPALASDAQERTDRAGMDSTVDSAATEALQGMTTILWFRFEMTMEMA
jgi:hypothetical protein